jgi:hypothetical protein
MEVDGGECEEAALNGWGAVQPCEEANQAALLSICHPCFSLAEFAEVERTRIDQYKRSGRQRSPRRLARRAGSGFGSMQKRTSVCGGEVEDKLVLECGENADHEPGRAAEGERIAPDAPALVAAAPARRCPPRPATPAHRYPACAAAGHLVRSAASRRRSCGLPRVGNVMLAVAALVTRAPGVELGVCRRVERRRREGRRHQKGRRPWARPRHGGI